MKKGYFATGNGNIYYQFHDSAESEKPVLVFVHGNTLDLRSWQPQVDFFADNYNILTYDMRGFGKSDIPTQPSSRDQDLINLMQYLNITKPILIGISLGALVVVDIANNYPDAISGLVIIDPVISGWDNESELSLYWEKIVLTARTSGIDAGKEYWLNAPLFKATLMNPSAMNILTPIIKDFNGWNWFTEIGSIKPRLIAREGVNHIKVPALIIFGDKDMQEFKDCAEWLFENIKEAVILKIPNAGHLPNLEAPEQTNSIIATYLNTIH